MDLKQTVDRRGAVHTISIDESTEKSNTPFTSQLPQRIRFPTTVVDSSGDWADEFVLTSRVP